MDDLDKTFDRLKRTDILTLEETLFNFRQKNPDEWVWIEDTNSGRLVINPRFEEIIKNNGWTVDEWMHRIDTGKYDK